MYSPIKILSQPGIKRDGTQFEGNYYTDGQWCRFQRGLPRKIAGHRNVTNHLFEKVYGMGSFSSGPNQYVHLGEASRLEQAVIDNSGNMSILNNRTPVGFPADPNNLWQFSNYPSAVAGATDLIAHGAPNLEDIASQVETSIYFGQADLSTALVATGLDPVSGGAVSIGPYVFGYGNGGFIQWSDPNDPTAIDNTSRVTGQKVIRGLPLRGGGNGPAGIFWSLDALVRGQFSGGTVAFLFDELATDLSVMSSRSIIEYDGVFYWWNVDRCLMFNGVVREVPNQMNVNFFLDGLNFAQRQKIFAYKVPRFGEIWWCYPRGTATECSHAIILNVRENTWYDTALPSQGRTSGLFAQVYPKPFMTDAFETATGFSLWQQETGVDEVNGAVINPIPSFFQTGDISMMTSEEPNNKALGVSILEPDFVQVGDMTVTVTGKSNARAPTTDGPPITFVEDDGALDADDQIVRFKEERRELRFKFSTNTPGGDYQMGQPLAHVQPSDSKVTS